MRSWLRRVCGGPVWRMAPLGFVLALWLAGPAAAQESADGVRALETKKAVVEWAIGTVFLAACLVVAFKNARRTHLD